MSQIGIDADRLTKEAATTIKAWVDAWHARDWALMTEFTQKHFVASMGWDDTERYLEGNFGRYTPLGSPINIWEVEAGLNRDVARDYGVALDIVGIAPPVVRARMMFRLVREDRYDATPLPRRWWRKFRAWMKRQKYAPLPDPSVDGTWGVNPISVLRRTA